MADEDLPATGRVARALHVERTGNRDGADALEEGLGVTRLHDDAFRQNGVLEERRDERVRSGLHRHPHLELGVGIVTGAQARLGIRCDGEEFQPLVVEPQIELAIFSEAQHAVVPGALQADRNLVLAVDREAVPDSGAAARPDRHGVVHAIFLPQRVRDRVGLERRRHVDVADRRAADLARRQEIALEQRRRHREHVADIVEAVADVVRRQEVDGVDIDGKYIADRVGVFRPVQAMERRAPRIGPRVGDPVALALDRLDQHVIGRVVGPRRAGWRHLAAAQLAQNLFPGRAVDVEIGEIERLDVHLGAGLGPGMAGVAILLPGSPNEMLVERRSSGGYGCFRRDDG